MEAGDSVDLAVEEVVLFLAGRGVAADGTADQRGNAEGDENGRQVTTEFREMGNEFVHSQRASFQAPIDGTPKRLSGFSPAEFGESHIGKICGGWE